jgi:hypothetical protein
MARIPGTHRLPDDDIVPGHLSVRMTVRHRWLLAIWYVTPGRPWWLLCRAMHVEVGI